MLGASLERVSLVDASAPAAALRSELCKLFAAIVTPSWVNLSGVDLALFCGPKDLRLKHPLLWTTQTEALWNELVVEPDGDSFRGQILVGPSGNGKSHIALLLALRCYAMGMPVLYVADAGEYLACASGVMQCALTRRCCATLRP